MNIYSYKIVVEYAKPWNITRVFDNLHTDCTISENGNYWCTSDHMYWYYTDDLNNGPRIYSGTDEDFEDYICICISQTTQDKTDINIEELQNKVKDLYIQELQNIIKNCNETINKIERS